MEITQTELGSQHSIQSEDVQLEQTLSMPTEVSKLESDYSVEAKTAPILRLPAPKKAPASFTNIDDIETPIDSEIPVLPSTTTEEPISDTSIEVLNNIEAKDIIDIAKSRQDLEAKEQNLASKSRQLTTEIDAFKDTQEEYIEKDRALKKREKIVSEKTIARNEVLKLEAEEYALIEAENLKAAALKVQEAEAARVKMIADTHTDELFTITDLTLLEQRTLKVQNLTLEFLERIAESMVTSLVENNRLYGDYPLIFDDTKRGSIMNKYCENGTFYAQDPIRPIGAKYPIKIEFKDYKVTITNSLDINPKPYLFSL